MAWIKRNLFFTIAGFVALVLMGVGIWMLIAQMAEESKVAEQIAQQYVELKRLNDLNPHPGDANIDNIKNAKDQEVAIRAYINKIHPFFQRIPAIPDFVGASNKVSDAAFAAELRNTVSTLRHQAEQLSVMLPPDYYFTFESQRKIMIFDPTSLDKLAVQLGEIKALSDVLFDAKINSLDGIRREVVSTNDSNTPDYIPRKTKATPLADLTPYEVTFRSFSTELALVMSHLASSPYGFVIKSINVEPTGSVAEEQNLGNLNQPGGGPPYRPGDMPLFGPGGRPISPRSQPQTATPAAAKGPQAFLTEKLFRVTLLIEVVKLKSAPAK